MEDRILTPSDLKQEISEWHSKFPRLREDELFVAWFLRAFVTEDETNAANSLTGGSGDKDVDAIYIDDDAKIVFVVQGKYRQAGWGKPEKRAVLRSFASLAIDICGERQQFQDRIQGANPSVVKSLRLARKRVLDRDYDLELLYVTTGNVPKPVRQEVMGIVGYTSERISLDIVDGQRVLLMLSDYLDGVAPPIPLVDLPMESGDGMRSSGALRRFDPRTKIESWVFSMGAGAIADIFGRAGRRLFARNVRGFLGNTDINAGMQNTLDTTPRYFWYYNNGITIVCDKAEQVTGGGKESLRVSNPQIINGQQTTRVLHEAGKSVSEAGVLVKVIMVPRSSNGSREFEELVSNIVQATNWQNAIKPSDLMSNDRVQIELERQLSKIDYNYIRKRQTKREARSNAAKSYQYFVKKDEFAQAVAACDLDSHVVRLGKERLFEERLYSSVFPNSDPDHYLPRYWLMRHVATAARGYPERAYAKWLVLHFVWGDIKPLVRSKRGVESFVGESETHGDSILLLERCLNTAFRAALKFFRVKRGRGAKAADVSSFFKRKGLDREFLNFWKSQENKYRSNYAKQLSVYSKKV